MNTKVSASIEGDTLTLTNGKGETETFEIKGKTVRDINVQSSTGKTTFTYNFPNGVTVVVTSPGHEALLFSISVSKDGEEVYSGTLIPGAAGDDLIRALKAKAEKGGNRKKTIRSKRVSRKKPAKLSRRRKFTHSK